MEITSRPYQPDPELCCEACVFGRGEHAEWCALAQELPAMLRRLSEAQARFYAEHCRVEGCEGAGLWAGYCSKHHHERSSRMVIDR